MSVQRRARENMFTVDGRYQSVSFNSALVLLLRRDLTSQTNFAVW